MPIWPRRRRRPSRAAVEAQQRLEAAERELAAARRDLEAARDDDDPVAEVAEKMRALTRRNHFGPMITEALRGSRSR